MDGMEGILLVPPDPRQILGRAVWKPRYVMVGKRGPTKELPTPSLSQTLTTSRILASTPKQAKVSSDEYVISIFKCKIRQKGPESQEQGHLTYPINPDDWEFSTQYAVSAVTDSQVQMVAHRKQGPVLPTLVIHITDKDKKRRSSRAAGLIPSKESSSTTLWFRNPPDDHHPSLHEWARFIMTRRTPLSPESPASPNFMNPFAPRGAKETPDYFHRPSSGNPNSSRTALNHKQSSQTHGSRDRPVTFSSESPSLRSKRSDISSPSSATHPHMIPGQHYTTVLPTDLPSPVGTLGEYQGEFIEGWTAAQGRSSALSSPARGRDRDSMSSPIQVAGPGTPGWPMDSSSPPGPRETILDRAFQLRCIPGSERDMIPGEEKLSSLARFDALMREADERRRRLEDAEPDQKSVQSPAWEADNDQESSDEEDEDDEYDPHYAHGHNVQRSTVIPPHAQRALEFIAGRHGPPQSPRSPPPPHHAHESLDYDNESVRTVTHSNSGYLRGPHRPHTAHAKSRPNMAQRTQSTPQLAPPAGGSHGQSHSHHHHHPSHRRENVEKASAAEETSSNATLRPGAEKRQSGSSTKRLSFTEFTKRLSSTSSLLLVQSQSNTSANSSEPDVNQGLGSVPRGTPLNARGAPPPLKDRDREREREEWEKRCGWRGSVGLAAAEGGFL